LKNELSRRVNNMAGFPDITGGASHKITQKDRKEGQLLLF
jgi:hypothetical protein